jgi:hypothetical protein
MIKIAAFALLAAGVLLTMFGANAMNSTSSDISRFFTGAPTDRALWMLTGGVAMVVAGIAGLLTGFKKN